MLLVSGTVDRYIAGNALQVGGTLSWASGRILNNTVNGTAQLTIPTGGIIVGPRDF